MKKSPKKAWLVAADMGYGHLRAALPLISIANEGRMVIANNYEGIPAHDKTIWNRSEKIYYFFSRFKERGGLMGRIAFDIFDRLQKIEDISKLKREEKPTIQLRELYAVLRRGWGRHLIEMLRSEPLPLLTTFFSIGHMADYWGYKEKVYVVATDTDISRAWAPFDPKRSELYYFAPTEIVARHLGLYGVRKDKIFLTGFPIPEELVKEAKKNLERRLSHFQKKEKQVSVTFSVGGAGAQSGLGVKIVFSLKNLISEGKIKLNLVAGVNKSAKEEFLDCVKNAGFISQLGKNLSIISSESKAEYFKIFDETLMETDILWTKPSELSFYAGLGLPIIIAPPIGSQEVQNKKWLLSLGAGIVQLEPDETHEWLPQFIKNGAFAAAAEQGFLKIEKHGARNIMEIVSKGK